MPGTVFLQPAERFRELAASRSREYVVDQEPLRKIWTFGGQIGGASGS
jgi:hypothetical protein